MFAKIKSIWHQNVFKVISVALVCVIISSSMALLTHAEQAPQGPVKQVASSGGTSFAIDSNNDLFGTGLNTNGQIGNGTKTNIDTWTYVLSDVTSVTQGSFTSYAVKTDGSLWATGTNASLYGNGSSTDETSWTEVISSGVSKVYFSVSTAYALKTNGTLWATGSNNNGQFGNGSSTTSYTTWTQVLTGVSQMSSYNGAIFALKSDGTLWATGYNHVGQLGNGTTTNITTWTKVLSDVKSISCVMNYTASYSTDDSSFAVKTDGSLWVTGGNSKGQLGNGTTTNITTWTQVLTGVSSISSYYGTSFAAMSDNTLYATGSNSFGQFGNGTSTDLTTWTQVGSGVSSAYAEGQTTAYIIKTDGSLWAAGANNGHFGNGSTTASATWIQVLDNVGQVLASPGFALKNDGSLWVTGGDSYGRYGLGSSGESITTWTNTISAGSTSSDSSTSSTASGTTSTSSSTVDGMTTISGTLSGSLMDVSFPSTLAYSVDGSGNFTAAGLDITNNSVGAMTVTVDSLKSISGGTLQFTDVEPTSEDWDNLDLADSKKYIALGVYPTGSNWTNATTSTFWSIDTTPMVEGSIPVGDTATLQLTAKHGKVFDQSYTALHQLVLAFSFT